MGGRHSPKRVAGMDRNTRPTCSETRILVEHDGHSYGVATPLGKLPAHSRHVRPPQETVKPESDRTRFDQLLTSHDEAVAFEQAGYMRFHPEGDDGQ